MSVLQDSGSYWLGKIPENWQMLPAWALFSEGKEKCLSDDPHLVPSRVYGVVTRDMLTELSGNKPVDNEASAHHMKHVEPHDFVISMGSHESGIEHSRLVGKVSNDYRVLRPASGVNPEYYKWFFKSEPLIEGLRGLTTEIRVGQRIHYSRFSLLRLPLPSAEDQQRIADYLDRETAEIDAAVADLDKYVKLLEKRRRLVVTKAVAGDVGPGEGFSGSWDQVPLRAVSADGGLFVDGDWVETKDQDPNGEIRLTQLADVGESVFLDKSDRWVNESKFEELGCTEVLPGDLLIARMPDPIARCTVMPDGLGYSTITVVDVAILRVGFGWNNRYVMWAINSQSFRNDVDSRISGSTRQRISRSALGRTKLFRPPLEIQQQIAEYLDRETSEIDSLITESTKLRDLLLNRRSVLITEVVTGRKQV